MTGSRFKQELPGDLKAHFFGSGPEFDLSLELGPTGGDTRGNAALARLWMCANVDGPWFDPISPNGPECQFGMLKMGDIAPAVPFIVHWIQEQRASEEPSEWLTLGIPVRALRAVWPVDGSWRVATQPWLSTLCSALAVIADHVHARVPFSVGVMGEEASGCWRRPTPVRAREAHQDYPPLALLSAEIIEERGGFLVAPELWAQLVPTAIPAVLPSGLFYVPPQVNAALLGA
jgi:hypothetical protein